MNLPKTCIREFSAATCITSLTAIPLSSNLSPLLLILLPLHLGSTFCSNRSIKSFLKNLWWALCCFPYQPQLFLLQSTIREEKLFSRLQWLSGLSIFTVKRVLLWCLLSYLSAIILLPTHSGLMALLCFATLDRWSLPVTLYLKIKVELLQ